MALSGRTGSARLSSAAIQRVRDSAKALGYRGNYHARTLSSGRSQTIGLAVGSGPVSLLSHRFWSPICGGIELAARAKGFDVLLIGGTERFEPLERALHHLEARQLDALIALPALYGPLPAAVLKSHLPIVIYDDLGSRRTKLPCVRFDDRPGIEEAVAHLAGLGHSDILWIGSGVPRIESEQRREHLAAAAARHGLAIRTVRYELGPHRTDGQITLVADYQRALADRGFPTSASAIMCWNEAIALAVYGILAERGAAVPRDVSIIGFDDLLADLANPALTTISHACQELGMRAVELATDLIEGRDRVLSGRVETVPARLVVRSSTAPASRR